MSYEISIELADEAATEALGVALGQRLVAGDGLALRGEMGAGKTCLTRGVAQGLKVEDPDSVASPTYLLVVEHPGHPPLIHIDAYLPEKTRSFLEDGGYDYLAEVEGVIVVEWADRIADLLPEPCLWLDLAPSASGGRQAKIHSSDAHFRWIESIEVPGVASSEEN